MQTDSRLTARQRLQWMNWFFVLSYAVMLLNISAYLRDITFTDAWTGLTAIAIYLSYSAVYLVPTALLTRLVDRLFRKPFWGRLDGGVPPKATRTWLVMGTALALTSATHIFVYADKCVFLQFGMHLNGFIWNTLFTKGGIESTGSSKSTLATYVFYLCAFPTVQVIFLAITRRMVSTQPLVVAPKMTRRIAVGSTIVLVLASIGQALAFGISDIRSFSPILATASAFPLYFPVTFRGLARKWGFDVAERNDVYLRTASLRLAYPAAPLQVEPPEQPLNIVWLVAESWRADTLDPEIMPKTWAFAQQAHRFTRHYSGGNGTRMAMFSMFYGLYGSYWFPFLGEQRSPVIMDVLQQQDYELALFTSARFTYPEFDRTLFARVPTEKLVEDHDGAGWERDRRNVDRIVKFLDARDTTKPFLVFEFFESPHAPYHFPDECAIRKPYMKDFNYATADMVGDIPQIRNRYINSCNHLDTQIARVLDALSQRHLLDTSIVLITGDHGEEFLEKGRWGHNSAFSEEQLRVPMVLWIPGAGTSVVDRMTSHLDIVPTMLPQLGVRNSPEQVSQGVSLLSDEIREYAVVADWSRLGYVDGQYKATFPLEATATFRNRVTDANDAPLPDPSVFYDARRDRLIEVMHEMRRFGR